MIKKFQRYAFLGKSLNWIISYLNGRSQYSKINQYKSSHTAVPSSVPQGSILGPIFYLIYINGVGSIEGLGSSVYMFAVDSGIVRRGETPKDTSIGLAGDILKASEYFNRLNLLLNPSKTKIIHFDRLISGKNLH